MASPRNVRMVPIPASPRPQPPVDSYISLAASPTMMRRPSMFDFIVEEGGTTALSPDLISFAMAPPSKLQRMDSISRLTNLLERRSRALIGNSKALTNWEEKRVDLSTVKNRKLRKFYQEQNELIDRYSEIDRLLDSKIPENVLQVYGDESVHRHLEVPGNIEEEGLPLLGYDPDEERGIRMAILFNFVLNVFLLGGKAAVAVLSNSLSLIASLVDSALDFLSTAIIWTSAKFIQSENSRLKAAFPVGRARLEPIGVLVFSVIMIVSFIQVLIEAVGRLYAEQQEVSLGVSTIVIMVMTIVTKAGAWLWCRSVNSTAVRALAQDAETDVIFNVFSILFPLMALLFHAPQLDSIGAIILSAYVIFTWSQTALDHINHLTGAAAKSADRQVVLYLCMRFADCIQQITSLNAYYAGDNLNVEVDVMVREKMSLRDSHDVGESLQYALETLPMVERAFVHIDYRNDNFAGHLPR
ncbi:cation efflux family-domain-containing protein [Myxozyma melibiosi]|uniref:Cation efflux family-domain-containing protein n=1 Tax=Myxozyma melibiosi TaxID=54550 RepID=A0ABR1F877_9ASCO